ncbi:MAG: hypothetical protein U0Q18_10150 [Bryobacteraceae bacterium]
MRSFLLPIALLLGPIAGAAGTGTDTVALPAKTTLDMALVSSINEKQTGEQEITFKLMRELKVQGQVLAPKGTAVTGRVTRIEKGSAFVHSVKRNYFVVGVSLSTLDLDDKRIPVTGNLEILGPTGMQADYFVPYSHGPDKWGELADYRFAFKVPPPRPGESFFGVVREGLGVPKGLRMVFRTPDTE